ncbi:uncharacterized protein LOC135486892 isoform X3 [Lineus longissimus]|uniref:uncharacterized protein LOC135486892 isoform X3 n=1 Tax=Lineus longissimus TaxID=88925 RepID=UPI00315D1A48
MGYHIHSGINVLALLPHRVQPNSLDGKRSRVKTLETKKQCLMSLKVRRKNEHDREQRRLELEKEKLRLSQLKQKLLSENGVEADDQFQCLMETETEQIKQMEDVTKRLKKEHEKVREETVKAILEEQKLSQDIKKVENDASQIKEKRQKQMSRELDPFHQLFEERKDIVEMVDGRSTSNYEAKKTGATTHPGKDPWPFIPQSQDPFDSNFLQDTQFSGTDLFSNVDLNTSSQSDAWNTGGDGQVLNGDDSKDDVATFDDNFLETWAARRLSKTGSFDFGAAEDDLVFRTVSVTAEEDDLWCQVSELQPGVNGGSQEIFYINDKLQEVRNEMNSLNRQGGRLVLKNYFRRRNSRDPEDQAVTQDVETKPRRKSGHWLSSDPEASDPWLASSGRKARALVNKQRIEEEPETRRITPVPDIVISPSAKTASKLPKAGKRPSQEKRNPNLELEQETYTNTLFFQPSETGNIGADATSGDPGSVEGNTSSDYVSKSVSNNTNQRSTHSVTKSNRIRGSKSHEVPKTVVSHKALQLSSCAGIGSKPGRFSSREIKVRLGKLRPVELEQSQYPLERSRTPDPGEIRQENLYRTHSDPNLLSDSDWPEPSRRIAAGQSNCDIVDDLQGLSYVLRRRSPTCPEPGQHRQHQRSSTVPLRQWPEPTVKTARPKSLTLSAEHPSAFSSPIVPHILRSASPGISVDTGEELDRDYLTLSPDFLDGDDRFLSGEISPLSDETFEKCSNCEAMQVNMEVGEEIVTKTEHKKEDVNVSMLLKSLELQVPEVHDSGDSDFESGFNATFVPGKDSKPGVHVAHKSDGGPHGIRLLAYRRSVDESMEEFEDMLVPEKMDNIEAGIPEQDEEMPQPGSKGQNTLPKGKMPEAPRTPEKNLRSPTEEAKAYYKDDIEKAVRMMEEEEAPEFPEYVPPHEEERRSIVMKQKVLLKKSQSWAGADMEEEAMEGDSNLEGKQQPASKKPVKIDASYGDGDGEIEIPGYTKEDLDNVKKHWEEKFAAEKHENLFPKPASNKPIKMAPDVQDTPDNRDMNENIDTESIANLSSRKQQWEKMLLDKQTDTLKKQTKKSSGMVKSATFDQPIKCMAVTENQNAPPTKEIAAETSTTVIETDSNIDSESAIDREIRYNLERERQREQEHKRRHLAERLDSNDSSTEAEGYLQASFASATFHEMTEADRGTKVDYNNIIEKEVQAQQKRETLYKRDGTTKIRQYDKEYEQSEFERQEKEQDRAAHESIIEREIRLQRQREEEIQRERKRLASAGSPRQQSVSPRQQPVSPRQQPVSPRQQPSYKSELFEVETDRNTLEIITQESQTQVESATTYPQSTEPTVNMSKFPEVQSFEQRQSQNNVVVREIEEQQKRERELRDQRKSLGYKFDETDGNKPVFDSYIDTKETNSSYNREVSPFKPGVPNHVPPPAQRRSSLDSVSSSRSTGSSHTQSDIVLRQRHMVEPLVPDEDEEDESHYRIDNNSEETAVERTIRLQREREDDYRRSRGLAVEEPKPKGEVKVDLSSRTQRQHQDPGQKSQALKRLSTSQLQREIARERQRELDLKAEGTIRTTSDEHMAVPVGFTNEQRNERRISSSQSAPQIAPQSAPQIAPPAKETEVEPPQKAAPQNAAPPMNATDTTDGGVVMRKVSRQSATDGHTTTNPTESRIERELREMREREEELSDLPNDVDTSGGTVSSFLLIDPADVGVDYDAVAKKAVAMDTIAMPVAKESHVAMEPVAKTSVQKVFSMDPATMNTNEEHVDVEISTKTVAKEPVYDSVNPKQQVAKETVAKKCFAEDPVSMTTVPKQHVAKEACAKEPVSKDIIPQQQVAMEPVSINVTPKQLVAMEPVSENVIPKQQVAMEPVSKQQVVNATVAKPVSSDQRMPKKLNQPPKIRQQNRKTWSPGQPAHLRLTQNTANHQI